MKFLFLLLPALLPAQPAAAEVNSAARAAAALVCEKPEAAGPLFDKSFFRQISLEKLNGVFAGLYRENGPVAETVLVSSGAHSGHFFFDTARGWRIPAAVSVDPAGGGITGLFFSQPYRKDAALAGVRAAFAALPGRAGLLVRRLGPGGETLEALSSDEHFAVGPVFQLYVLGAMLREKTPWDRVFRLRHEGKSLPSGRLRGWQDGAPLTAHTLAALMISEDDGTAADALIGGVGRRRIEGALGALGHSEPGRLTPLLKTSEMFRLKAGTERALKYLNLPQAERYGFLAALARQPLDPGPAPRSPFGAGRLEWFASPADVCRLLEYFTAAADPGALELLAMNPGPPEAGAGFLYAGYKGGTGPGVLSAAWLLKDRRSDWFCLAASWNDEKAEPEREKFLGLLRSAVNALGGGGSPGGPQGP